MAERIIQLRRGSDASAKADRTTNEGEVVVAKDTGNLWGTINGEKRLLGHQKYIMPTANETLYNAKVLYQYIGITDDNFEKGHFYQVIYNTETTSYEWKEVEIGGGGGAELEHIIVDISELETEDEFDLTDDQVEILNKSIDNYIIDTSGNVYKLRQTSGNNRVYTELTQSKSELNTQTLAVNLGTKHCVYYNYNFGSSVITGGKGGLRLDNDGLLTHTNTLTARTVAALGSIKYDAQGHLTAFTQFHLYQHVINIHSGSTTGTTLYGCSILSTSNTAFTYSTLGTWLTNNGFTSDANVYPTFGITGTTTMYVAASSGGSPTTSKLYCSLSSGIYCSSGTVKCKVNFNGSSSITSTSYLTDKIITIV